MGMGDRCRARKCPQAAFCRRYDSINSAGNLVALSSRAQLDIFKDALRLIEAI
jgi:hypothetical protein